MATFAMWEMRSITAIVRPEHGSGMAGRVMDLVESGKLATDAVKFFVLDEADRLLDTGNLDTIMKLFGRFPKAGAGESRLQVQLSSPLVGQSSGDLPILPHWV